ncbi:glycosyltransferase family 2 protein [Nonomuraea sp. NPDC059194]|uniref:glycosyltransferase family 2 protein n=1 Tax=Nonomuraea sp. NPDC059194 TaxID=3346764 RepID=UPI0036AC3D0D
MTATPSVDTRGAIGFLRTPTEGIAPLRWEGARWTVEGAPLPEPDALRTWAGLSVEWPSAKEAEEFGEAGRRAAVDGLLALACAGVPLTAEPAADVPPWVPADLGRLLADRAWPAVPRELGPRCVADLRREEHSVRLRRLAPRPSLTPTVSVVMSSMRPHLLGSALDQIARQRHVQVEVLLGLHGIEDHPLARRAVEACAVPIRVVSAGADVPFGALLNRAASHASGDYLAKWDDDDWYGPDHLADLLLAKRASGADIVGTAAEFFYLEPLRTTIRRTSYRSETWSDFVAGGTILLDRDGFPGFEPLTRGVDAALLKARHADGARIYRTHGLGYVLRRSLSEGHTWQLPLSHFLKVAHNQWRGFRPSLLMEST